MSIENLFILLVQGSMMILGGVMLWTHTKNRWLFALFMMLSVVTATVGWMSNYPPKKTIPPMMLYTVIAVEYSMTMMDRKIDALLGKETIGSKRSPHALILLITVMLCGALTGLFMSPPSAFQSNIVLVVAIVLIALALVHRITRILLRGHQTSAKENP